jgi:hypothetical protein
LRASIIGCTAALCLIAAGCQYDPYTLSYARAKPPREQLVGTWLATDESLRDLHLKPRSLPYLDIREDGSISLNGVPAGWRDSPAPPSSDEIERTRIDDFRGKWSLTLQQKEWWGLVLEQDDWSCGGCLMVMHAKAAYQLVLRYGDPDLGLGLEFARRR